MGTSASTLEKERHALEALYAATDGASWTRSDGWNTDAPVASWFGVETDQRGRVIGVRLGGNGLRGERERTRARATPQTTRAVERMPR